jgi:hypothetical protein
MAKPKRDPVREERIHEEVIVDAYGPAEQAIEGYFNALVNMFEQALKTTHQLSAGERNALIARLERVRTNSHNLGYGVGDDMESLLADHTGN